jgi:hypothetical protein
MNKGAFGISSGASGHSIGLQTWTLGYQYVDETPANTDTPGAGSVRQYAVRIVPKRSCLLASIDVFCKGNASNVHKLEAAIADDAPVAGAGDVSKPGKLIAISAYGGAAGGANAIVLQAVQDTTPRWVSIPMARWLEGGVPVWLIAKMGYAGSIYYDDYGTAVQSDFYEQNAADTQGYFVSELNITWVASTKRWMIRGSGIQ